MYRFSITVQDYIYFQNPRGHFPVKEKNCKIIKKKMKAKCNLLLLSDVMCALTDYTHKNWSATDTKKE